MMFYGFLDCLTSVGYGKVSNFSQFLSVLRKKFVFRVLRFVMRKRPTKTAYI